MLSLDDAILRRRNLSPLLMNGQRIPDELVRHFLELADWAPTHANTEPWHFTVFSGDSVTTFCEDHAEMYARLSPPEKFDAQKATKLRQLNRASHVIAIALKPNPTRLPEIEEIAAVACAVQNLWLAATVHGIVGYWGSGGMTYHPVMRDYLRLAETDKLMGFLYLGYPEGPWPEGKRVKPLGEKVRWV